MDLYVLDFEMPKVSHLLAVADLVLDVGANAGQGAPAQLAGIAEQQSVKESK